MGNTSSEQQNFPIRIRKRKYGWKRDLPDQRDIWAAFPEKLTIMKSVDLRKNMPAVFDQGDLGSCTANALAGAFEYDYHKQNAKFVDLSRLFIYYYERVIENTVDYDSGAALRDGIKVLDKIGVCPEVDYPYDIYNFRLKPSEKAYTDAKEYQSLKYRRINPDVDHFKRALSLGYPVVFGFTVYESFEGPDLARTGIMSMPKPNEQTIGGHAVVACGYDSDKQYMLIRNSWGSDWGQGGYFWMPFKFITPRNCSDVWIIERIKNTTTATTTTGASENAEPVNIDSSSTNIPKSNVDQVIPKTPNNTPVVESVKTETEYEFKEDTEDPEDPVDDLSDL